MPKENDNLSRKDKQRRVTTIPCSYKAPRNSLDSILCAHLILGPGFVINIQINAVVDLASVRWPAEGTNSSISYL